MTAADKIATVRNAFYASIAAEERRAAAHHDVCVRAGTESGPFLGFPSWQFSPPRAMAMKSAVDYVARWYAAPGAKKAAIKRALVAAIESGAVVYSGRGKIAVNYGDGRHSPSGFPGRVDIGYDKFDTRSIEEWAAAAF